ncbi:lactonase family protein [Geminicoccus harenae]|uniref:lactonase family protein n=1 Tax=Geminicoccus harenae TaxID=2498453 RepID=UPI00168C055D|nr:lactonase family protein [Geminicoccus harenae]
MASATYLFVGSLNRPAPYFEGANGAGISLYRFDDASGAAELLCTADDIDNPTFLTVDPARSTLYASSEVFNRKEGTISAYRYELDSPRLQYLNMQPALGSITAYNSLAAGGRLLLVANYAMGEGGPDQSVAILPIREDGSLGPATASVAHAGSGPNRERQERSHAHCAIELPGHGNILVADLGLDQVVTYRLDADGQLQKVGTCATAPGAGPRHLAVHPSLPFVFVINELGSTVSSLALGPDGQLSEIATVSTLPAGTGVHNDSSDLQVSPDGRFLYGLNRGHDSVAIIEVGEDGGLTAAGHVPCGGRTPRNCALTPSGNHLLVANQNSDVITVFRRDAADGSLADLGRPIATGTPMCIRAITA